MNNVNSVKVPQFLNRVFSVWNRHARVYRKNFLANAFPPLFEPLILLLGLGLGLAGYVPPINGIPYVAFLASGIFVTTAMWTASFECTYGTFIRLEFDKVYDGMLAAPISVNDLLLGEVLWAGTKGFFFSAITVCVTSVFGVITTPFVVFVPLIGFIGGIAFAVVSLWMTSIVGNIDNFNFYFTGFLSPMFFFSGVVFPLEGMPLFVRIISEALPMTHLVRMVRAVCFGNPGMYLVYDALFMSVFIVVFGVISFSRLRKKLID